MNNRIWTVDSKAAGQKLLDFLVANLDEKHSKRQLKRAIERGQCLVKGRLCFQSTYQVQQGDRVSLCLDFFALRRGPVAFERSRVLYEDDLLLIYDKPPFVSSDGEGLCVILAGTFPGLALAHRLDVDTSGALIFVKGSEHLPLVTKLFRARQVHKRYLAIVDGIPYHREGKIQSHLGKLTEIHGKTIWGEVNPRRGRLAVTEWKRAGKGKNTAVVCCMPETGRTHQIRIHLANMGHPILGDYRYGKRFTSRYYPCRHLLHASAVSFQHPLTQRLVRAEAPLPEDFQTAMSDLQIGKVNL